ncbi:MAG: UvrD-helicase domain-containing protein, partial [Ignavibacteriales bacterium]|nr:UvrD-helicase domain-containing protein [Ignavibacteriales bacterium]
MTFLQDLNPVQRDAVEAANGPVMIIAGAGSGKTRVLTYRIAHLIACGVSPGEILALTFTNKAAREMKERIVRLVGEKAGGLWMGTFHSMFARVLRKECELIGYTKSFTIYDSDDSLNSVKTVMGSMGLSPQRISPQLLRSLISGAKNQLLTPRGYKDVARDAVAEQAAEVYRLYEKHLERSNAMDFDDLLVRPTQLFTRYPEVLQRYQYKFKFILIDEFQDTNRAQYHVVKLLSARFRNICVVGDDAQSIYAFRGADIRNILDFKRDFPHCQTFRLEQNYRSTKTILAAADRLIGNNVDRLQKNLWTENQLGEPIEIIECADDRDEGQAVVQMIQNETAHQKHQLSDIAVLYRTNAQSRAIEDELRRSGIPYVIVGGVRFYERKEIKDVLAYMRLLVNPKDAESLLRVVNYPPRGIGETTMERLALFAKERDLSLFDSLSVLEQVPGLTDRARGGLQHFRTLLQKYADLRAAMSFTELVRSLVDELGILRIFKAEETPESVARWENVQELLSAITEFQEDHEGANLEEFLEEVALVSDVDAWEGTSNAVTLMTLHSSKGLEFPVVMITGVEEGILPFYSNSIDRPSLEEERRLAYVGMTRAKEKLYLSRAKLRYRFGEPAIPGPSRFLSEIGTQNALLRESKNAGRASGGGNGRMRRPVTRERRESIDAIPDYESESQEVLE